MIFTQCMQQGSLAKHQKRSTCTNLWNAPASASGIQCPKDQANWEILQVVTRAAGVDECYLDRHSQADELDDDDKATFARMHSSRVGRFWYFWLTGGCRTTLS